MRLLKPIASLLETGDPAATVDRLFQSQHVRDLQLIIGVAFLGVILVLAIGLPLAIENQVTSQWKEIAHRESNWIFVTLGFTAAVSFLSFFAPVLVVFGAVLAWAYRVGSARLGVVDLFACEISTLCRITTIFDTVGRYIGKFTAGPPMESPVVRGPAPLPQQFTSQENYFPVFESNTRDLQSLEARVVINITAFYTYMKAVRDALRRLAEIGSQPASLESSNSSASGASSWQEAVRNLVYLLFLALESARHAICDLVEFEPEKAERTIVILISELEAYRFLRTQFTAEKDVHHQRLMLRIPEYGRVVDFVCRSVKAGRAADNASGAGTEALEFRRVSQWEPAWQLLDELRKRYEPAVGPLKA